jgi:hypothetical protein
MSMSNETMVKALETMTAALQAQMVATHPTTDRVYAFELGRKYARVYAQMGSGRSVYAFVDVSTGDIFKPASWKGPAKGVRGNLFSADYMSACGVYGVARLA